MSVPGSRMDLSISSTWRNRAFLVIKRVRPTQKVRKLWGSWYFWEG